ncbi:hypothetical protein [Candidatus Poriferisodalis sp.]|uniref:hypothetical protein n=1 Tax=Candidatus Poriferisodalis sp. TaxID=3101277 RepID=UPI003D0AA043
MNSRKQASNPSAVNPSGSRRWFKLANVFKVVVAVSLIAGTVVVIQMAASGGDPGEQVVVAENRDSPEPPETTVQPDEERSAEAKTDTSEVIETVPTTSTVPVTTQPEDTGSETETVTEEEEEVSVEDPEEGNNGETSEPEETGSETETVTEEEEEVSVEDPEEGNNGETSEPEETGSETETVTEEEEDTTEFVLEIGASPVWVAEELAIEDFALACGYVYGRSECDDSEDSQILVQMIEEFYDDRCGDFELGYGCSQLSSSEMAAFSILKACPLGWSMRRTQLGVEGIVNSRCYHPDHDQYYRDGARSEPEEADPRGVRSDHWISNSW